MTLEISSRNKVEIGDQAYSKSKRQSNVPNDSQMQTEPEISCYPHIFRTVDSTVVQ
jgi:hypothetical protein